MGQTSYQPKQTSYQPRHPIRYSVYQPRYRSYYSERMRDNRAEERTMESLGQEESSMGKLPGLEEKTKEIAHQIVVKQSVHQNVDHYHILVDKEQQNNEEM